MNAIDELCLNCGLCCDSTLFEDVELRKGDDRKRLATLGLTLKRKKDENNRRSQNPGTRPPQFAFAQPCGCFDGRLCRIYDDRPKRCRLFECGLLKRVASGKLSTGTALKRIAAARALAERVRRQLEEIGERPSQTALGKCYARAMEREIDLADETDARRRGELMLAVRDLMQVIQRDFLTAP